MISGREVSRFEVEILTTRKNLKSLMAVPWKWIDRAAQRRSLDNLILDLNSSVSDTYGRRERLAQARHMQFGSIVCLCESPCTTPSVASNLDAITSKYWVSSALYRRKTA